MRGVPIQAIFLLFYPNTQRNGMIMYHYERESEFTMIIKKYKIKHAM